MALVHIGPSGPSLLSCFYTAAPGNGDPRTSISSVAPQPVLNTLSNPELHPTRLQGTAGPPASLLGSAPLVPRPGPAFQALIS